MTLAQDLMAPSRRLDCVPKPSGSRVGLRVLEVLLILFMLHESGVILYAYRFVRDWHVWLNTPWTSGWINEVLRQTGALAFLGYVWFRNARWGRQYDGATGIGPPGVQVPPTWVRVFEVVLVLYVAFGTSVFHSFDVLVEGRSLAEPPTTLTELWLWQGYHVLRMAGKLGVLGYVLYRGSRTFTSLGLHWNSKEVCAALPLAAGWYFLSTFLKPLALFGSEAYAGHSLPQTDLSWHLHGPVLTLAAVVAVILNGFCEELIVRAYLMTEIKKLTHSLSLAIAVSTVAQVSYHFYQGAPAAFTHVGWCLLFSWYYARTNRVMPLILAHNFANLGILFIRAAQQM